MRGMSSNIQYSQLLTLMNKMVRQVDNSLPRVLAKVTSVEDEGYSVEIEFINQTLGAERISGIPVLKNKYVNYPILEGDLVILLTMSETLDSYTKTKNFTNALNSDTYFAVPYTMFSDYKHKNEISLISPQENITARVSDDDGIIIENKRDFELNSNKITIEGKSDIGIKSNTNFKTEALTIEMKTSAMSLGDVFEKLIDCFANTPTLTTQTGGSVNEWAAILTQLQSLKSTIKQAFK